MNRFLTLVAAAAVAAIGAFFVNGGQNTLIAPAFAQDAGEITDMSLGNPEAEVTVIEYASFTCPHCRRFHEGPFKDLKTDYIDTGKINFVYREVYFDRFGLWAGMLARCGGEERYFGIVDLLYETQSEWAGSGDPTTVANSLRRLGRTAGLSDDQVNACLQDNDLAEALVATYQENATEDGVRSTPSFIINGRMHTNMSYTEMKSILDEALGS